MEQTISVSERQSKVLEGLDLMVKLKINDARDFFDKIKNEHPHYFLMYTITIYVDTVQNFPGNKTKEDTLYKLINSVLKSTSSHCHLQLNAVDEVFSGNKQRPKALDMQRFAGCQLTALTLLLKASLQIRQTSYIKAGVSFRKSWKFYDECYRIITEDKVENELETEYFYDVLFGVGVFSFVVSLIPPTFTFFVEAIGFKGDREKGFKLLKECSEQNTCTGFISLMLLQLLYQFYFEDSTRAVTISQTIFERFPGAIVPLFASGYTHRFLGDIEKAETNFEKLYNESTQCKQLHLSCLYELGSTYVKKSEWAKAIENIFGYLKENPPEGYRCYAAYEIGVCYCYLKDYDKAKYNFKKSLEWVRKEYAFDVYAARKSKQFLDSRLKVLMSPFEQIYFEAREKYKVSLFEESLQILLKAKSIKDTLSPDDKSVYFLLYGELIRKKDMEKSLKKFERATKEKVKNEIWAVPHAYVELAKIAMQTNRTEDAKRFLRIAREDYKNYDFMAQLLRTITRLYDKISGVNYGVE